MLIFQNEKPKKQTKIIYIKDLIPGDTFIFTSDMKHCGNEVNLILNDRTWVSLKSATHRDKHFCNKNPVTKVDVNVEIVYKRLVL